MKFEKLFKKSIKFKENCVLMSLGFPVHPKVVSVSDRFERISRHFARARPLPQEFEENLINESICELFTDAAKLLHRHNINLELVPNDLNFPETYLSSLKLLVEQMDTELERRIRQFEKALMTARHIFTEKLDYIKLRHRNQFETLCEDHRIKEAKMEQNLRDFRETFEGRLRNKVSSYLAERDQLESDIVRLKGDTTLTQTTLKASIAASQMRAQLLAKQKSMLLDTNLQVEATMRDKYKQQMEGLETKAESRIAKMQSDNDFLQRDLQVARQTYNSEFQRLKTEIDNNEDFKAQQLESAINKAKIQFEKRRQKIDEAHQAIVLDLTHQIQLQSLSCNNTLHILNAQIAEQNHFIDHAEQAYLEACSLIEKKRAIQVMDKENAINLAAIEHDNTMKQISAQHELDVNQLAHEGLKSRNELDQTIFRVQRDGEAMKRKMEREITALTRERDKLQEALKSPPVARKKSDPSVISSDLSSSGFVEIFEFLPQRLSRNEQVEEQLLERVEIFSEAATAEEALLQNALESANRAFEAEHERITTKLAEASHSVEILANERDSLKEEVRHLESDLANSDSLMTTLGASREEHMKKVAAQQEALIATLKEDLNRPPDQIQLNREVIEKQHLAEMAELRARLGAKESELKLRLHTLETRFTNEFRKEQTRTQEILDQIHDRIAAASRDLTKVQQEYQKAVEARNAKWRELKQEAIKAEAKLLEELSNSRPTSSTKLPRLRRA
jgi:hypothetical protein